MFFWKLAVATRLIEGLEDVSTFPALFAELARRGWTEADLRKVAGENVLRVIETAEKVAARLQRARAPSVHQRSGALSSVEAQITKPDQLTSATSFDTSSDGRGRAAFSARSR